MAWHKRLLGRDETKTEFYWSDPDTGEVALETKWHGVDHLAEWCKELERIRAGDAWKGDWHHVASIPLCVIEAEKRQHGRNALKDKEFMRHLCNRDDLRAFRTKHGRV